jgi:hypothetical protein
MDYHYLDGSYEHEWQPQQGDNSQDCSERWAGGPTEAAEWVGSDEPRLQSTARRVAWNDGPGTATDPGAVPCHPHPQVVSAPGYCITEVNGYPPQVSLDHSGMKSALHTQHPSAPYDSRYVLKGIWGQL